MINEEDHLRIQILLAGLKFEEAWLLCSEIDDKLEVNLILLMMLSWVI